MIDKLSMKIFSILFRECLLIEIQSRLHHNLSHYFYYKHNFYN
jgi:hypothetical protein